jgi:hypothetical protein
MSPLASTPAIVTGAYLSACCISLSQVDTMAPWPRSPEWASKLRSNNSNSHLTTHASVLVCHALCSD